MKLIRPITLLTIGFTAALFFGCTHTKELKKPSDLPPPMVSTDSLGRNIQDLDKALQSASSRAERIRILVDAISDDKSVILPER